MISLKNKVAIVTGSVQGIGFETARMLGKQGASVVINHYRNPEMLDESVASLKADGIDVIGVIADVTTRVGALHLVDETVGAFGKLDILVNNAGGIVKRVPVAEFDEGHYDTVMNRNLKSAFLMANAAMPQLKETKGRLINIASLAAADGGGAGAAVYSASKAAMVTLTRALTKELAPSGITVNTVSPGFIQSTTFHDVFTAPELQEKIKAGIPLGRAGNSDDVSKAVLFFASEMSDWITGQNLEVNGGVYMK